VPNFYRIETAAYDLTPYNRFLTEPLDNAGGRLRLADRPGLGVELDPEYLRGNVLDGFGG
jgi:galactonate dehydratase